MRSKTSSAMTSTSLTCCSNRESASPSSEIPANTSSRPTKAPATREAPPADLGRYFYFEDVREQDSLFRYVVETVLDETPSRSHKSRQLTRLREAGVFLIDLKSDPKLGNESLDGHVPDLVARAAALAPEHVITIKANVCDLCQGPLRAAMNNAAGGRDRRQDVGRDAPA